MIRSPHLHGDGLLLVVILAMAFAWRHDHAEAAQKMSVVDDSVRRLEGELQKTSQNTAILDGYIDHLVGELQKNSVQIERMPGGGFRRTFGVVPPEYRIKGATQPSTETSPYYGIGTRIELPGSDSQPY